MASRNHPAQPVRIVDGVARFSQNGIVRHLVDSYPGGLNALVVEFDGKPHGREDYEQLMMLIGYSVDGYAELSCHDPKRLAEADEAVAKLRAAKRRRKN